MKYDVIIELPVIEAVQKARWRQITYKSSSKIIQDEQSNISVNSSDEIIGSSSYDIDSSFQFEEESHVSGSQIVSFIDRDENDEVNYLSSNSSMNIDARPAEPLNQNSELIAESDCIEMNDHKIEGINPNQACENERFEIEGLDKSFRLNMIPSNLLNLRYGRQVVLS